MGMQSIDSGKVLPTSIESPQYIVRVNIVSALPDPRGNSAQRQPWGGEAKVYDLYTVPSSFPSFDPSQIRQAAQSAFECKINLHFGQPVELCQEKSARSQSRQFRPKR